MAADKKSKQQQIPLKAEDSVQAGVYSNVARISHDAESFVLDFVFVEPQRPAGRVVSRVVTNPRTAKLFLKGMQEMVRRYEERFGEIKLPEQAAPSGTYH